ncbi:MAG: hypothetical protein A2015_02675 [Spirochaetes bacterium GWF1_31_7]|nr:MAG: hypothetical protein A2Y30_10185 [Spirochaetes bacterium GWE1_32_154]OHD44641.1 MAG: hypothetical protein A2Y29_05885 [Spirochaetes bacterium GWE2_31_10]OHD53169.1 MAG: hypothetical protein A2015_02675 [Spirochaetes bacterium GWF1_31_7]HBD94226.1 hypothetical protein [Spirochaetia bacterium]HBI39301.1 hypothetical protein [Spirochaetia bacterium]
MRKTIVLCMFLLSFIVAYSQTVPSIVIQDNKEFVSLKISDLDITVKVVGNIAETTMNITFFNAYNRILEGDFYFPLKEGQTVSGFALEVNGKLRDAVVVEKEKGRAVFESVVRKNIDPGLLEWTKGNNFKSRIYPIPAKGYKQLKITYREELTIRDKGFSYMLPLAFKEPIDTFRLKIEVIKQLIKPEFGSDNEFVNLTFEKWQESYTALFTQKNYQANKDLHCILPQTDMYKKMVIEKSTDTNDYFYIHLTPEIKVMEKKKPSTITLFWDASGSGINREIKRETTLLDGYFKEIGNVAIQLIIFRNEVETSENYTIKSGNSQVLRKRLENIEYDGATQLGCLDLTKYKADECIISTDGVGNFGKKEIILSNSPVYILNSNNTANHSYLNFIAQQTGGAYINLKKHTDSEAINLLSHQLYSFIKAEYDTKAITEVYPAIKTPVTHDFSLSGILQKPSALITLHFGIGNTSMFTEQISLSTQESVSGELLKQIWASKKLTQLDMNYEKNASAITALGKEMGIVTRNTSLIVLDRIEDYVQHRIVPPVELQKEYFGLIAQQDKEKKEVISNHLDEVVRKFKELETWWNKEFSFDKVIEKPSRKKEAALSRSSTNEERMVESESRFEDRERSAPVPDSAKTNDEEKGLTAISGITLKKWSPDTPYLQELNKTPHKQIYEKYLQMKNEYSGSSAFYLDVADFFIEKNEMKLVLRILSNIAEMELENPQLLRILGHRLSQLGYYTLAIAIFEEVLEMRGEEPQSYRDLALVCELEGNYQRAIELLYHVVINSWDARFPDIEIIALTEMNKIIHNNQKPDISMIDKRLLKNLSVDMRVVLNWDADNTDMDLWVFNPNGEKCFYSNPQTLLGEKMSRDFTGGYGPEVYMLRRAKNGTYEIKVNYYGNNQQILSGSTTIQVTLFRNYGRKNETKKEITMRLKDNKEVIDVGEFDIK